MSRPDISARLIGHESQPLVTIDGFATDPDALRAFAIARRFEVAGRHYPGVRAALPPDYLRVQSPVIASVLAEVFGCAAKARVLDASYSMVTTPPEALSLEQRLPHVDATAPGRIALIHYLSPDCGDGTAFFRHRTTGYETIDDDRATRYFSMLEAELRETSLPLAYVCEDTPLFERVARSDAHYNRALIYRSALLHTGAISPGATLSSDPATGRLTITAFLDAA